MPRSLPSVQRYPVKPTHRSGLEPVTLTGVAQEAFGEAERDGDRVVTKFGAIRHLRLRGVGRELEVDIEMDPKVSPEIAAETVRRYNRFLEAATGYSAKERAKRLRKSSPAPGA